jgi:hypothetical protein
MIAVEFTKDLLILSFEMTPNRFRQTQMKHEIKL